MLSHRLVNCRSSFYESTVFAQCISFLETKIVLQSIHVVSSEIWSLQIEKLITWVNGLINWLAQVRWMQNPNSQEAYRVHGNLVKLTFRVSNETN